MRLFSRAEFARLADVSGAAITKVAKKWPAAAFQAGRIDVDHQGPRAYLASRGITEVRIGRAALAPTKPLKRARKRPALPTDRRGRPPKSASAAPAIRPPAEIEAPEASHAAPPAAGHEAPSDEVVDRIRAALLPIIGDFGTARSMADWIELSNDLEDLVKRRLANEQARGRLMLRELVRNAVFGAFDAVALKLIRDMPKTLSRDMYAMAKSDSPIEAAELKILGYVEKILEPMKVAMAKTLRSDDEQLDFGIEFDV
jgi:hypothetical protein